MSSITMISNRIDLHPQYRGLLCIKFRLDTSSLEGRIVQSARTQSRRTPYFTVFPCPVGERQYG